MYISLSLNIYIYIQIYPTSDAVVAVGRAAAGVAGNVLVVADLLARRIEELEVGLLVPLLVAIHPAQLPRPRPFHGKIALGLAV